MGNLLLWLPAGALLVGALLWLWAWRARPELLERATLREALVLTIFALLWVAVVAAMTEDGYAGKPALPGSAPGHPGGSRPGRACLGDATPRGPRPGGGERTPGARSARRSRRERGRTPARRAEQLAGQAATRSALAEIVDRPGMRKQILACRPTTTHPLMIPPVAWTLDVHLREVGFIRRARAPSSSAAATAAGTLSLACLPT